MTQVFNNSELNKEFNRTGYLHAPAVLNGGELEILTSFFGRKEHVTNDKGTDYAEVSMYNSSPEFRREAFNTVTNAVNHIAAKYLKGYTPLIVNFLVKNPGKGIVPLHQNLYVVDEAKHASITMWIPLTDVDGNNGALGFIEGTQHYFRGERIIQDWHRLDDISKPLVDKYGVLVPAKKGDVVFLEDAVFHFSPINQTGVERIAVQVILIPETAQPLICSLRKNGDRNFIDVYEVDKDFFIEMNAWKADFSRYKLQKSIPFSFEKISMDAFNHSTGNGLVNRLLRAAGARVPF